MSRGHRADAIGAVGFGWVFRGFVFSAVAVLLLSVLQGGSRAFVVDDTLRIVSPTPLQKVSAPFSVRWTEADGTHFEYAVFIDLAPIAPGHSLRDLATSQCKRVPSCRPTADYLSGLGVYLTNRNQVTVPTLLPLGGIEGRNGRNHDPVHTAIVVRLIPSGVRVGDVSWQVQFHG